MATLVKRRRSLQQTSHLLCITIFHRLKTKWCCPSSSSAGAVWSEGPCSAVSIGCHEVQDLPLTIQLVGVVGLQILIKITHKCRDHKMALILWLSSTIDLAQQHIVPTAYFRSTLKVGRQRYFQIKPFNTFCWWLTTSLLDIFLVDQVQDSSLRDQVLNLLHW